MTATRNTLLLLLLAGCLAASGAARAQEPPPYPGNEAPQGGAESDQGTDSGQGDEAAAPAPVASDDSAPENDPAVAGVTYFHEQLSPYGHWVVREGYGEVWVPEVEATWRPYTTGHWVYTDQGWAWVADEPWGWAAFHYGRWYYDREIGWAWVPGTVWAPAWVAWRHGGGYLGWAPLPPAVGFSVGIGLDFGGVVITPGFYTFVGERDILAPRIAVAIVPSARNVTIVNNTVNITNYTVVNNRIVNNGVSVQRVEQVTGRRVQTMQVAALASAGAGGKGAFYQPPVIAKAARVTHAEFGKSLPTQVAAQQRAGLATRSSGAAGAGARAGATTGSSAGAGRRTQGQSATGASRATGATGSHAQGQSSTGATGSHAQGQSPTGTAAGRAHGQPPAGTAGTAGGGPPSEQGSSAGNAAASAGRRTGAGPAHPPPSGSPQAQAEGQRKPAPPPAKEKPKEKEKEKEHKPPPA
ncbi:MAG TPA: DUF6600 domain-containing protein [Thermoanaerobaculia bacterium]|jgi:hypothetical protein|nr:DUF6600 domain-containing protein [Thermoanaerobaculia bacterium]